MSVRSAVACDTPPEQGQLIAWFLDQPQPDASACAPPLASARDDNAEHLRRLIETTIGEVFGVAHADLCKQSRGKAPVALARQAAMYLAHVSCGLNLTDVGRIFARDRTTVAHACAVIEDRRDDPVFDRALELMEWIVPTLIGRNAHHPHRDC
ncbi:helix-turn-helix domain-containing protein [Hyphomicrobium sp. CS1GBMeth3]|uniref:helix-turn-helix domain-containing protein n=1 Tax=Hyphomicrobium sp. CS1GBMeth3 TaxID=1892845 RepID=UPI0009FB3707|nr:helix-turn-helix domain-containing protein [Hyphomicrobium sp. CS1GBMeth3]